MKKIFKFFVPVFLSIAILFSMFPAKIFSASLLDSSQSCTMHIKSGWNLISFAELACGLMKIDYSSSDELQNFPAYLDVYAYDGSEYIYARVNREDMKYGSGRSIESASEKYLNSVVKKATSGKYTNYNDFERGAEQAIEQNNISAIKEYAGRLNKELFSSLWVYNPGRDLNSSYVSKYKSDDEILAILAVRGLITDTNSSTLLDYIESNVLASMLRELENENMNGYLSLIKESVSGRTILDNGWSFLSYSRLLADDNGALNFSSSNCDITKAYVFDNSSKKWISTQNATRSMIGSGVVVYNNGSKCTLSPNNSILNRMKSMLRGGSDNLPPVLPN